MGFSSAKRSLLAALEAGVHVFRPIVEGARWYVKAYFLEESAGTAVFISVHR